MLACPGLLDGGFCLITLPASASSFPATPLSMQTPRKEQAAGQGSRSNFQGERRKTKSSAPPTQQFRRSAFRTFRKNCHFLSNAYKSTFPQIESPPPVRMSASDNSRGLSPLCVRCHTAEDPDGELISRESSEIRPRALEARLACWSA